ncbi:hypothetical protein EV360DRAFT_76660, partial [Lentinula raphanica]
MAHALRPDIPSRRARNALSQVPPGLADLNPAPRAGQGGLPPSGTQDRVPTGTFQSNRPLNGERGVAARREARICNSVSSVQPESAPRSSSHEWDPNAFPADLDLFRVDMGGDRDTDLVWRHPGSGGSPLRGSPHSAHPRHRIESEGGSAGPLHSGGPIAPESPGSDGCWLPGWTLVFALVGVRAGDIGVTSLFVFVRDVWCPAEVHGVVVPHGLWRCVVGDIWCPVCPRCGCFGTVGARLCPFGVAVSFSVLCGLSPGVVLTVFCLVLGSDSDSGLSEWGGIDGELRVYGPPPLGPPIELRSTR